MRLIELPAFIDLHVHLREPGQTHKGDIVHESAAAKAGGFGTILAMANTTPAIDRPSRWLEQQERIGQSACKGVRILQCAAMTIDRAGKEPVDAAALRQAGVIALSDDGSTTDDSGVMREVAFRGAASSLLLIDHCEKPDNSRRGELELVERDILTAQDTHCRFHLQHLSCAESVEMLRQARRDGLPVTGEVTPHHLALSEGAIARWGSQAKMSPPLRTEHDRKALIAGLADGVISVIATDHAPHASGEKALPFDQAPNGIIGIESAFAVCYTTLVASGLMTLDMLIDRMVTSPAAVLGIQPPAGTITAALLDTPQPIDISGWKSMARNCPWDGFPVMAEIMG